MQTSEIHATGIRFAAEAEGREIGHAYVYFLQNDLHAEPLGILEDLHVDPGCRHRGIGRELVTAVLEEARRKNCYKLIATSRNDGTRDQVHAWYLRLGFREHGTEFRMDL